MLAPSLAPPNLHGFARNKVRLARDCEENESRTKRRWRANISQYGVVGGRMQGYLPPLYLFHFSTDPYKITLILCGFWRQLRRDTSAGGAGTICNAIHQGGRVGGNCLPCYFLFHYTVGTKLPDIGVYSMELYTVILAQLIGVHTGIYIPLLYFLLWGVYICPYLRQMCPELLRAYTVSNACETRSERTQDVQIS